MKRCPRCDTAVETLHPVPREELREGLTPGAISGSEVCPTCLNEIREG